MSLRPRCVLGKFGLEEDDDEEEEECLTHHLGQETSITSRRYQVLITSHFHEDHQIYIYIVYTTILR